jgi:hypothetical protein
MVLVLTEMSPWLERAWRAKRAPAKQIYRFPAQMKDING